MELKTRVNFISPDIKILKDESSRNVFTQLMKQLYDMFKNVYDDLTMIDSGRFAGIYAADNSTAQSIPTGATYTKITAFNAGSEYREMTADYANDRIVINKPGHYFINGSFNFQCGTNNVVWRGAAFLNDAEQDKIHIKRKISTAGDVGSASFCGIISVTTLDSVLDFRARHDNAGSVNVTFEYLNLTAFYIGRL